MKGFFFIGYLSEEEFVEIAMQGTDAAFSILGGIVFTNDFSEHNMSFNIKYKIRLASITVSAFCSYYAVDFSFYMYVWISVK